MVGNGATLFCSGLCVDVPVTIQSHHFTIPFYVLPIHGANVILGVQWLQTLGPFVSDYTIPSMQFYHQDQLITLQGTTLPSFSAVTFPQFNRMLQTQAIATIHSVSMLSLISPELPSPLSLEHCPPDLAALLHTYASVFSIPHGLPPSRSHDHHIHLLPHSAPINVRPYRYPHCQKEAMATLISEMLQDGVIRPSTSPYSSPVLLVKKKDGNWRLTANGTGSGLGTSLMR